MTIITRCNGHDCYCPNHVGTSTHVACCPTHGTPLIGTDSPGFGRCVSLTRRYRAGVVGGQDFERVGCVVWSEHSYLWRPRAMFDYRDLPPEIGEPVQLLPREPMTYRLDVVHRCESCELELPHAQVDGVLVCLKCGRGAIA